MEEAADSERMGTAELLLDTEQAPVSDMESM
jgi:hypothetical protein